jgi:hypothetical protein
MASTCAIHAVATRVAQQPAAQPLQRRGQVGERRAVAQRARLSLQQQDVVLPVVAGLAGVAQALVPGHHCVGRHNRDTGRVQPRADHLPDELTRHRVGVARHRHQAVAGHPRRLLAVAVERRRHGHEVRLLVLEHLGHAELRVLGTAHLTPKRATALSQPGVELREAAEALLARSIQMRRRLSCTFFSITRRSAR